MKTLFITLFGLLLTISSTYGQVAINTDDSDADASAALDIKSTVKGVLVPNLSETERNAVPSPATGLFIYNRTVGYFNFYNGTNWMRMERTLVTDPAPNPVGAGTDIGVGVGIADPDNSAILHINSNNKGLLLPRPNSAISSPIAGVIYYSTTANNISFYNGTTWKAPALATETAGAGGAGTAEGVVIGGTSVNASAKLEVISTDKGMALPRMTTVQRDAIVSPTEGLLIYSSSNNQMEYFVDSKWYTFTLEPLGSASTSPGASCLDIYNNNVASQGVDGVYWIDTDGSGGNAAFQCDCDMTTDSGGWTLVVSFNVGANSSAGGGPGNNGDFFRNTTANRATGTGNVTTDVAINSASWWTELRWGGAGSVTNAWSSVTDTRSMYNQKNTDLLDWLAALGTGATGFSPATNFKCAFGDAYVMADRLELTYSNLNFPTTNWNLSVRSNTNSDWSGYVPSMHLNTGSGAIISTPRGYKTTTCTTDSRTNFLQAWVR